MSDTPPQLTEEQAARLAVLKTKWLAICPPLFQDTDPKKLPDKNAAKKLLQWEYSGKGLVLHGPTRKGKSRSCWLLMQQYYLRGKSIRVLNSATGLNYAAMYADSPLKVKAWFDRLIETDILFMDDVFKIRLTDSFESVIFSVIDQRSEQKKPFILTLNDTAETLKARMTADRSEPLLARLAEFCDTITFE